MAAAAKQPIADLTKLREARARDLVVEDTKQFFWLYAGVPELEPDGSAVKILHDFYQAFQIGQFDWDELEELQERVGSLESENSDLEARVDELESDGRDHDELAAHVAGAVESLQDALTRLDDLAPNDLRDTLQALIKRLRG